MTDRPDPGGHFASDAHRRVMANLPNPGDDPLDLDGLILRRVNQDQRLLAYLSHPDQLVAILKDLEADGHAELGEGGWRNTEGGFELLTSPPADTGDEEPGPAQLGLDPAQITVGGTS